MKKLLYVLFISACLIKVESALSQEYNFISYTTQNGLISNRTTSLVQDKRGYLWIGTDKGVSRFDGSNFTNYTKFDGLSENNVLEIKIGIDGNIYLIHPNDSCTKITSDNELSILEKLPNIRFGSNSSSKFDCKIKKSEIKIFYNRNLPPIIISEKNGLQEKEIQEVIVDRENILWICTKEKGLLGLPLQNFPLYSWNNEKLNHCYQQQDNSCILSFDHNIVRARIVNGKPIFNNLLSITNKTLNCAKTKQNGEFLYGTNKGLYSYFSSTYSHYSYKELIGKNIKAIESFNSRDLIVLAENTLYKYESRSNKIIPFEKLKDYKANSIIKLNNSIYILGKGNIYKLINNEFVSIFDATANVKDLNFTHLSEGLSGIHWISTANFGLFQFNTTSKSITNFSKKNKIPYTSIISCVQEQNNLWISTKNAIIWFDIERKTFSLFGNKYFTDVTFLPYTIVKDGHVFFITNKGIVKTFDSKVFENSSASLDFTKILVSGKEVKLDPLIDLNQSAFPIEFNYQSISLKDKIYYQYLLFGKDKKWSNPTLNTSVSYNYLEAGNYSFKIRTYDPRNGIILNENQKSFIISIPYWKTPWFLFGVFVTISALIVLLFFLRTWRLKKQKLKLERMVNEKTFKLTAQNQNIEQFSFSLSHDLKNPINNIKGLAEILMDADEDSRKEINTMLLESTQLLEDKIKATLETIKQMQANKNNLESLQFEKVLAEVKNSLLLLISESKVKFNTSFNEKSVIYNSSILESIFYNLISNSIKYGSNKRQKTIWITTKKLDNNKVSLTFEDNGIGFDTNKDMDKVFSIFERVHEKGEATGTGIGLYMIKQMIELNGGIIEVESEVDKGTKFHITLPNMK